MFSILVSLRVSHFNESSYYRLIKNALLIFLFPLYDMHIIQKVLKFYLNIYIYSICKSNNYSWKSARYKSIIILWEEDDAKQLYLVLKDSEKEISSGLTP